MNPFNWPTPKATTTLTKAIIIIIFYAWVWCIVFPEQAVQCVKRHLCSARAPFAQWADQTARRATAARTYTLQKRDERERGERKRRKIQRRRRRGATTTPPTERSPHLRPEGAQRGQPSETRAPGTGPPRPPDSSETPRTWQTVGAERDRGSGELVNGVDMLSTAAELWVDATRDLKETRRVTETDAHIWLRNKWKWDFSIKN